MHVDRISHLAPPQPTVENPETFLAQLTSPETDPTTLDQAKASPEWPKWQSALNAEYNSLRKRGVFGPLISNLPSKPIGHKLIFMRKRDEDGKIVRFKVRLVAQGFTQRPGVDYKQTYSLVMDSTSFRYILSLAVQLSLETRLLDVVTAYLYGDLHEEMYIKPPPGYLTKQVSPKSTKNSGLRLYKASYGLKQAGRTWYHRIKIFLLSHGFTTHPALPCIFVLRDKTAFVILEIYVDDLNPVGTKALCMYVETLLATEFEMKILGRTTFCLGLQINHFHDGSILIHQEAYVKRLLRAFKMDQANPLSAPMVGRRKINEVPYRPAFKEEEEIDKPKYLAAVGALLYLATHTRPDISFAVSVLARYNQRPAAQHWQAVKHLMRYLRGIEDLGLHFRKDTGADIVGYTDFGFKTDKTSGKSQTGYIFLKNRAPISWRSTKQTVTATSTNHAELLAFHEASREAVWLRTMRQAIIEQCGLTTPQAPTMICEDNAACLNQVSFGFIKADRVKHISPHLFR